MFERCWPVANTDLMDAEQRKQLELNVGQVRAFMRLHSLKDRALMVDLQRSDLQLKGLPAEVNRGFPRADRGRILCALIRREVGHARNVSQ